MLFRSMKNCLTTKYPFNPTNTNVGGWNGSAMRTSTMQTLLSQLPSDLQSIIKTVNKKATSGNNATDIVVSPDKLFLLSVIEIMGDISPANGAGYVGEGEQYEYWRTIKDGAGTGATANPDRIKYAGDDGAATIWWLRSPRVGGASSFLAVNAAGAVINRNASGSNGVSFGFCV